MFYQSCKPKIRKGRRQQFSHKYLEEFDVCTHRVGAIPLIKFAAGVAFGTNALHHYRRRMTPPEWVYF